MIIPTRFTLVRKYRECFLRVNAFATGAINKETRAVRATADYGVESIKHTDIVGKLNVSTSKAGFILPGRKRGIEKDRTIMKPGDCIAGNSLLSVHWQIPEAIFTQFKARSSDSALCLAIFSHGSTTMWSCSPMRSSVNTIEVNLDEDGTKNVAFHSYLDAPPLTGDYVVRLFHLKKKEKYSVRQVKESTLDGNTQALLPTNEFSIKQLIKHYHVLATAPKFHIRGNFVSELGVALLQASKETVSYTMSRLLRLLESISEEKKLLCLLNGVAFKTTSMLNLSVDSAKDLEILRLRGDNRPSAVQSVDFHGLDLKEKSKLLRSLLLQSVEFVVHCADMQLLAQSDESWKLWQASQSDRFDRNELRSRYPHRLAHQLYQLVDAMLRSPVVCEVLQNQSPTASDNAPSTPPVKTSSVSERIDLHGLIHKLATENEEEEGEDDVKPRPAAIPTLTVLSKVLLPEQLTRSTSSIDGRALLKRLRDLQSAYYLPLRRFLPREGGGGLRSSTFLQIYGFVPDKYQPHTTQTLKTVAKELTSSVYRRLCEIKPPTDQFEKRTQYVEQLQQRLSAAMTLPKGCSFGLFGSSGNGFGSIDSDIDICCFWSSPKDAGELTQSEGVQVIGSTLFQMGMKEVQVRPGARIPVALFADPNTGYSCDIAVTDSLLSLYNTELLRAYASIDPRVAELGLLLKYWAKARNINDASHKTLNSYTLLLMMIQFLQMLPVPLLPSLQKLPPTWNGWSTFATKDNSANVLVDPITKCNVYFYRAETEEQKRLLKTFAARNTQSTEELLLAFFHYYGSQFNYSDQVVSIRMGSSLTRRDKSEDSDWVPKTTLSVEDPFETGFDTAHFVKSDGYKKVLKEFVRAAAVVNRLEPKGQKGTRLQNYTTVEKDGLPDSILPEDFFKVLCDK